MESAVKVDSLTFSYDGVNPVLKDISFSVKKGEFIAILGANGSGKSTLIRIMDLLLTPDSGKVFINGESAESERDCYRLRENIGVVFQNPEDQFVSTVLYEDIAFGPENYGYSTDIVSNRVSDAISCLGLEGKEKRDPYTLSGGEMQRAAIAGALALQPDILIFDEPFSMVDSITRHSVEEAMEKLRSQGKTIILVTHYSEDAVDADKILLLHNGKALAFGSPRDVFSDRESLKKSGVIEPITLRYAEQLASEGVRFSFMPLKPSELGEAICS